MHIPYLCDVTVELADFSGLIYIYACIVLYDTLIEISKIFNPVFKECLQEDIYTSSDELLSLLYRTDITDVRLNNKYPTV